MKKYFNKRILKFLIFVFIMGIFFGLIFKYYLKDNDLLVIKSEINDYFNLISNNSISSKSSLFNNFIYNFILLSIIFISGIIFIFLLIVPFIIFSKGFSFGFLIASLHSLYKLKGILYAVVIIFPFQLITIFLLIISSYYSIIISKKLFSYFIHKTDLDIRKMLVSYFEIYLILLALLLISNVLEVYVVPLLIKLVV